MDNSSKITAPLLIVSTWAPPMVGGPQNLYNLFNFISGDYRIITSQSVLSQFLTGGVKGNWLNCPYHAFEGGTIENNANRQTSADVPPSKKSILARLVQLVSAVPKVGQPVVQLLYSLYQIAAYQRAASQVVTEHGTQVLLGISDLGPALITTWLTGRLKRVPYVLYLFDLYRGNQLPWPYSWLARWLERPIMTGAKLVILTNEATEQYYQRRYGSRIRMAVVHNSIPDRQTVNDYDPKPPYTIVFTGNVYWPQEQAVMNMIGAMDKLADLPLTLKLFVPHPPDKLRTAIANKPNIELGSAGQDQMPAIQAAATLLFLPLAWDTKAPDIIATATPGKFTDYLDSGRPMLVHAPDYAGVSILARKYKLGLIVDKNSVDLLASSIRDFLDHPERGKRYIDHALKIFYANHEAKMNAKKLASILNHI